MLDTNRVLFSHITGAFALAVFLMLNSWVIVFDLGRAPLLFAISLACVPLFFILSSYTLKKYRFISAPSVGQFILGFTFLFLAMVLQNVREYTLFLVVCPILLGVGLALAYNLGSLQLTDTRDFALRYGFSKLSAAHGFSLCLAIAIVLSLAQWGLIFAALLQSLVSFICAALLVTGKEAKENAFGVSNPRYALPKDEMDSFEQGLAQTSKHLNALLVSSASLFLGFFFVIIPYFSQSVYKFSLIDYLGLSLVFFCGFFTAHIVILRRKTIERPGQSAIFCLLYMALIGFALSKSPTIFGFFSVVFFWGLNAGYSTSLCWAMHCRVKGSLLGFLVIFLGGVFFGLVLGAFLIALKNFPEVFQIFCSVNLAAFGLFLFTRRLWALALIDHHHHHHHDN